MADQPVINWTPEKLKQLRIAHRQAMETQGKNGTFMFDGHEILVGYATYLIQYLDQQFGHDPSNN